MLPFQSSFLYLQLTLPQLSKESCECLTACACLIKSKMSSLSAWWILAGPLSSHRHTAWTSLWKHTVSEWVRGHRRSLRSRRPQAEGKRTRRGQTTAVWWPTPAAAASARSDASGPIYLRTEGILCSMNTWETLTDKRNVNDNIWYSDRETFTRKAATCETDISGKRAAINLCWGIMTQQKLHFKMRLSRHYTKTSWLVFKIISQVSCVLINRRSHCNDKKLLACLESCPWSAPY